MSALCRDLRIGHGTIYKVIDRVGEALASLEQIYVAWPSSEERTVLGRNRFLPGCIGFLDGTHFRLTSRPQAHEENILSRKMSYSISAQIIVTSDERITYLRSAGFNGSWHDSK
jgi:hypothetical protein